MNKLTRKFEYLKTCKKKKNYEITKQICCMHSFKEKVFVKCPINNCKSIFTIFSLRYFYHSFLSQKQYFKTFLTT